MAIESLEHGAAVVGCVWRGYCVPDRSSGERRDSPEGWKPPLRSLRDPRRWPERVRAREVTMRSLPQSASVDHLRRQAKDLLVLLRHSQPSLTLSDAQAVVAREYGYDSWPQLKAAAERQH